MHYPSPFGFREISHTADWELEVWAPDLPSLLEHAARGMYHLTHLELTPEPHQSRKLEIQYTEPETLLIDFLSELIYVAESENIAFDSFNLHIQGDRLIAILSGSKIKSLAKEIKAATYHNLNIRENEGGLIANIVFDV